MNMSYCRFRNTLKDLKDCQEYMDDDDLSEEERDARGDLIDVCWRITKDYADECNELQAENAALRKRVRVLKAALEQIADDPRAGHSVRHNARTALAGDGAKEAH